MLIQDTDRVFDTYIDLVSTGHHLEESEITDLKETIFSFLVSLQRDPETRINENLTVKLGALTINYNW